MTKNLVFVWWWMLLSLGLVSARIHKLEIRNDNRRYISLSTFGFYKGGILSVNLTNFKATPFNENHVFGFTLDRTMSDAMNPYLDSHQEKCLLQGSSSPKSDWDQRDESAVIYFTMDLKNRTMKVNCSRTVNSVHIYKDSNMIPVVRAKREWKYTEIPNLATSGIYSQSDLDRYREYSLTRTIMGQSSVNQEISKDKSGRGKRSPSNHVVRAKREWKYTEIPNLATSGIYSQSDLDRYREYNLTRTMMGHSSVNHEISKDKSGRGKRSTSNHEAVKSVEFLDQGLPMENNVCSHLKLPMSVEIIKGEKYYNTNFVLFIATQDEEGLYNLYFHNCPNYKDEGVFVDFTMHITEINSDNYLSAGEMPLPALYFMMALLFFLSGCFWVFILKKSRHPVFKIHYLMAVLVYLKSLSLLFHGINYHFIQTKGEHVAAWAILYYIAHLLKGAVLFITIVLIGTGWTFIKHILADKDKKLFMIVIPLQVLANVAEIIIEESEEGDIEHKTWRDVFILVDLLCCGAIMFPVVWSIRHLQEAAHTDGKAVVNLRKLKLFRHFYIIIVCYIYITRIIVYLMKITVPFQYEWLDEMFREMATYVFFVLTGYKFRPASANPYFSLNDELIQGQDDDEMDVVLFSSVTGGTGLTEGLSKVSKVVRPTTSESTQEERDSLVGRMESSHEYD